MAASPHFGLYIGFDSSEYNDNAVLRQRLFDYISRGVTKVAVNIPIYQTENLNASFRDRLTVVCTTALGMGLYTRSGYTLNGTTVTPGSYSGATGFDTQIKAYAVRAQAIGLSEVVGGNEEDLRIGTISITSITRSGATATATKTAHGFLDQESIVMAGANQSEYNGTFTITVVDANTFTYTVSGTPATPATGTLTAAFSQTALMNRQIKTMLDIRNAGYTGVLSVTITTNVYALWKAAVASWSGHMKLYVNIYNTLANFKAQVDDMAANLPTQSEISELNTDNSGRTGWSDDKDWQNDIYQRVRKANDAGFDFYVFGDVISSLWTVAGTPAFAKITNTRPTSLFI